jgi:hypothetical protein
MTVAALVVSLDGLATQYLHVFVAGLTVDADAGVGTVAVRHVAAHALAVTVFEQRAGGDQRLLLLVARQAAFSR